MYRSTISGLTAFMVFFFLSASTYAFEPVNALDDGFAIPAQGRMAEASFLYPGAESFIQKGFATAAYKVPFGMEELSVTTFHTGARLGKTALSLSFNGSGFDLYGEEQEKVGISYTPFKRISPGFRITRHAIRIKGFGHSAVWSVDGGIVFHPFDSVYIAGAIENLTSAEIGESNEPLDRHTRLALSWNFTKEVTLLTSLTDVRRFTPSFNAGFAIDILDLMQIGAIGATEPDRFEFLCSLHPKGLLFSYHGSYHRNLGMTHGFSLSWSGDDQR